MKFYISLSQVDQAQERSHRIARFSLTRPPSESIAEFVCGRRGLGSSLIPETQFALYPNKVSRINVWRNRSPGSPKNTVLQLSLSTFL